MNNKHIHIISHTHWDREWYLPYEKHHMQLIDLMDTLLETLKTTAGYKSFHLDGQTIILDDYLQVRPEKREELKHFIQEGKIHIGPWYILQDEFLTSSESNIRNLQYGMLDANKWGNISKIGYFPDSFGNIGQAPQILRQAGINCAVFGRGVKPTGFNNEVIESDIYESPYSEMHWQSPDGSKVYGILFANWYCNGNEIPVEKEAARIYWENHIQSLEKYAASSHMLMMNGCDHQPIQTDLDKAIQTAEALHPDITFTHSNFNDYVKKLVDTLPENLKTVKGELRSQQTDGWGTLVNTASARNYLKQMNRTGETLLTKVAEPLETFAYILGKPYNHKKLEYAWKTLMQNHPHDSICGCSVDEVHRNMVTRFEDSKHVTESIIDESLTAITEQINTYAFSEWGKNALPFVVYNTTGYERTGTVSMTLDVKREYFADGVNKEALKSFELGTKELVDADGTRYPFNMEDLGIHFGYDLPKDRFRQPYMSRRIKLTFEAKQIAALGYKSFALVPADENTTPINKDTLVINNSEMENEKLYVRIAKNGSLTVVDKATGKAFENLCIYEDTGDIGNEYMYKQPDNEKPRTTENLEAEIELIENTAFRATFKIVHHWEIPKSATGLLEQEQKELVQFNVRKAQRTKETIPFVIRTHVSLDKNGETIEVTTSFNNQAKDHRLRVLFPTDIQTDSHQADSIFEVAMRPNHPSEEWTNPDQSQHQQDFVNVSNANEGLTIANYGLNEYELLPNDKNTIALTLLRSVGEMGDWGYFPTPEAQCLGDHTVSFAIIPHSGEETKTESFRKAYQYQIPWSTQQTNLHIGDLPSQGAFIEWDGSNIAFSSIKVSETSEDILMRWFNMADNQEELTIHTPWPYHTLYKSNVIEEQGETVTNGDNKDSCLPISGHEILTIGITK
ncbi:alpha-mannosidase [Paraliobacillus salinarum]|uniref:alpha-mannosidase n=1 Tax=Paraliobacillus salinarum TaxID=1158996 RepID=UPI0015F4D410|nr:alpha-mannosidase [Paraliobacillus salinarum]